MGVKEHVPEPPTVSYSAPRDAWQVQMPTDVVTQTIAAFEGRRRAFLVRLLNGWSKTASAAGAGVSVRATQLWVKADREFAEAVTFCEEVGFSTVVEVELYRRALGGTHDSGSMRALELVLKSRDPRYRDRIAGEPPPIPAR
jgi:hypothetical protein